MKKLDLKTRREGERGESERRCSTSQQKQDSLGNDPGTLLVIL